MKPHREAWNVRRCELSWTLAAQSEAGIRSEANAEHVLVVLIVRRTKRKLISRNIVKD